LVKVQQPESEGEEFNFFVWVWSHSVWQGRSTIIIYDANTFELKDEIPINRKRHKITTLQQVTDLSVWVGFSDGQIRIYDPESHCYAKVNAFKSAVTHVCSLPPQSGCNYNQVWAGDHSGSVSVWNNVPGQSLDVAGCFEHIHMKASVDCLSSALLTREAPLAAEGKISSWFVLSGDADGRIIVWDTEVSFIHNLTLI
jgi:WD40 repeat protein